jgi:hypothetical protein
MCVTCFFPPRRLRKQVASKRLQTCTKIHGVTSHETNHWPTLSLTETTHSFGISVLPREGQVTLTVRCERRISWFQLNRSGTRSGWTMSPQSDCLLAPELNHIISGPFSIIWRWQPFQNTGEPRGDSGTDSHWTHTHTHTRVRPGRSVPQNDSTTGCSRNKITIFSIDLPCGLVVRVPGYTTEMYCISCEVRTEFIYDM